MSSTPGPLPLLVLLALAATGVAAFLTLSGSGEADLTLTPDELAMLNGMAQPSLSTPPSEPAPSTDLRVASTPEGSEVFAGTRRLGPTPLQTNLLPPGWHTLSVERGGFFTEDTLVYVEPDRPTLVEVRLTSAFAAPKPAPAPEERERSRAPTSGRERPQAPASGAIRVEVEGRVPVRLDGQTAGFAPILLEDVPPGPHTLTFILPGFETQTIDVTVEPRRTAHVRTTMQAARGTLSVVVHPWGSIYIGEALKVEHADTRYRTELAPGTYTVRATHPQLPTQERTVTITPGEHVALTLDLRRRSP